MPHERFGSGYPRSLEMTRAAVALGHHVTIYPLQMPDESWDEAYSDVPREAELMLNLGTQGLGQFLGDRIDYFDTIIVSRPHNMAFVRAVLPPYNCRTTTAARLRRRGRVRTARRRSPSPQRPPDDRRRCRTVG